MQGASCRILWQVRHMHCKMRWLSQEHGLPRVKQRTHRQLQLQLHAQLHAKLHPQLLCFRQQTRRWQSLFHQQSSHTEMLEAAALRLPP